MVADRVVALPGTRIGRQTVMGTGALCKRNATYGDGETWLGNGMPFCTQIYYLARQTDPL